MEDTKQRILEKSLELFSTKGYDAVSVGEIAKAVGIKAPSLYNHFPSKQAIFDAILETTAAASWSRWPSGCARAASGPSSTAANAAESSAPTGWRQMTNPMKLMSIAMKPLCSPPFPLDYIEEMTALMGGDGRMR